MEKPTNEQLTAWTYVNRYLRWVKEQSRVKDCQAYGHHGPIEHYRDAVTCQFCQQPVKAGDKLFGGGVLA